MKKSILIFIATMLFCLVNVAYAENKFQIKGTVTKVDGNHITIKDVKGGEKAIEGDASGIKVGDRVTVIVSIYLEKPMEELTAEQKDFLADQCQVSLEDIAIIPQLSGNTQARILKWVTAKDCKKLTPLKDTRNYYRKLKPNEKLPTPPATWDFDYLTDEEFIRYTDILNKAPL